MLTAEAETLASDIGQFTHDPLGFVKYAFPWNEGELEASGGPWSWQRTVLEQIGSHLRNPETRFTPCRIAVSSGHGIGKSSLLAQIVCWALSTFEDTRIRITANTANQLEKTTQPEIAKWARLAINSDWFDVHATSLKVRDGAHEDTWRADMMPWSESNPQAFAGLHNKGKRLLLILDEASEIADVVWEVAQGALTDADTEIIWLALGNPTRSAGAFYEAVFGHQRHRWKTHVIDSRTVEGSNKAQIAEWIADYGEDSDFVRVRALGLPPRAGSGQFIDLDLIHAAQSRNARSLPDDALIAGVDFAWGGIDDNVVRFRCGFDARSIKPIKIKGEFTRDPGVMTARLASLLTGTHDGKKISMMFVDSAGIAGPVVARLRALGHKNIQEINFGADSPDPKFAYFRDYMWGKMKEWLAEGAIDKDPELEADLSGPSIVPDLRQRVKLEPKEKMKKRGLDSPDDADALGLTFAFPVMPKVESKGAAKTYRPGGAWS